MRRLFYITVVIVITLIVAIPYYAYSQSWGTTEKTGGDSFFDSGNKTQVIVNEEKSTPESMKKDQLSGPESTWNIDLEGLAYMMPDQPVRDQMITTFTGLGGTYKFSDKMQVVAKAMQFKVVGKDDVEWTHEHYLIGIGMRSFFGDSQQWQINLLTGESSVKGNNGIGSVKNLELPMFLDIKYQWVASSTLMIGPQITFGRVANSCEEPDGKYTDCGHGGYTSISLNIQIGLPDDWGK